MRALLLEAQAPIETAPLRESDVPVPEPGPGEVLLRVRACGICHTDLHVIEGDLAPKRLPLIPGHQIVGEVVAHGPEVTAPELGTRAGTPWLSSTCGSCGPCREGRENLCEHALFTGYDRDGGFAEYVAVPAASAYELPAGVGDIQAAPLLCAGVIGYRALRLSQARPGGLLGLYGFGASAHLVLQLARAGGVEVYVFTRSARHRDLARDLGAAWVGGAGDTPPHRPSSSIIFAPAGSLVPEALRVLEKGGTLAVAGIYMTEIPPLDYNRLLYHERVVRSVANSTHDDVRKLLDAAGRIPLRIETETVPLGEANGALARLKASKLDAASAVVELA